MSTEFIPKNNKILEFQFVVILLKNRDTDKDCYVNKTD